MLALFIAGGAAFVLYVILQRFIVRSTAGHPPVMPVQRS
jgi:hypothetical protein